MAAEFRDSGIVDVEFGENVIVMRPVNLYGCSIGDDCFIGPFVEIQNNVRISRNCRIQSHAFVCDGVTMGEDCFIGHGVMFVNDTFAKGSPARGDRSLGYSCRPDLGCGLILSRCTDSAIFCISNSPLNICCPNSPCQPA